MDYKEKYEQALERARGLLEGMDEGDYFASNGDIENIFPELKKSEDERIRNFLFDFIKICTWTEKKDQGWPSREDCLAWLEKQESYYTFEIKEGHWYKCVCDYMLNGSDLMFKNDSLYYCRRNWRLTGEIDERNVKDIGVNGYKSFFRPATNQEIKDWLEKQGEKKPTDKVEQKFKVGDWIVNNVCLPIQIASIKDSMYIFTKGDAMSVSFIDENFHLWTIYDAMDGDVLVDSYSEDSIIILYKEINKERSILAHCGWNGYNFSVKTNGLGYGGLDNTNYLPATKEQRDMLFRKMKEEGYEWDSEKKELKKIEAKSLDADNVWLQNYISNVTCLVNQLSNLLNIGKDLKGGKE